MKRNDWCLKDGEYHLTVLGVIMRPDQKFLITKRVMTKAWAPGWWEVSGGAAQAGESSEEAVRREIREETGLLFVCVNNAFLTVHCYESALFQDFCCILSFKKNWNIKAHAYDCFSYIII